MATVEIRVETPVLSVKICLPDLRRVCKVLAYPRVKGSRSMPVLLSVLLNKKRCVLVYIKEL